MLVFDPCRTLGNQITDQNLGFIISLYLTMSYCVGSQLRRIPIERCQSSRVSRNNRNKLVLLGISHAVLPAQKLRSRDRICTP